MCWSDIHMLYIWSSIWKEEAKPERLNEAKQTVSWWDYWRLTEELHSELKSEWHSYQAGTIPSEIGDIRIFWRRNSNICWVPFRWKHLSLWPPPGLACELHPPPHLNLDTTSTFFVGSFEHAGVDRKNKTGLYRPGLLKNEAVQDGS